MALVAAAAAAAVLVATAIWHAPESPPGDARHEISGSVSADLARLVADWDTEAVDRVLLETSTVVLPEVQAPGGALRLLARP